MTTEEKIKVMQAYLEGKTVEAAPKRGGEPWYPLAKTSEPIWNFAGFDFRIKPEPRELFVIVRKDGCWPDISYGYQTKLAAEEAAYGKDYEVRRFREVIE